MKVGEGRTAPVPKSRAAVYLRRARNLLAVLQAAETAGNADGVATNGVQAVIALADAFTIAMFGLRARGQDHRETVRLVASVGTDASSRLAEGLRVVLSRKTDVEYGDHDVTWTDAARIARLAREISQLVEGEIR